MCLQGLCVCACRGYVYARNGDLPPGWVAWSDNVLLHLALDNTSENMIDVLDPSTLQVCYLSHIYIITLFAVIIYIYMYTYIYIIYIYIYIYMYIYI